MLTKSETRNVIRLELHQHIDVAHNKHVEAVRLLQDWGSAHGAR
jgi:hypothetical protein